MTIKCFYIPNLQTPKQNTSTEGQVIKLNDGTYILNYALYFDKISIYKSSYSN